LVAVIDERADSAQRAAILKLLEGKDGGPWEIFAAITGKVLEPVFAPFEVTIAGLSSRARAGEILAVELADLTNPVTGAVEHLQLRKPTGFTSLWADLGKTRLFRLLTPNLSYDESGQYGEYAEFDYTAPQT
jgi:hypothetical protein